MRNATCAVCGATLILQEQLSWTREQMISPEGRPVGKPQEMQDGDVIATAWLCSEGFGDHYPLRPDEYVDFLNVQQRYVVLTAEEILLEVVR